MSLTKYIAIQCFFQIVFLCLNDLIQSLNYCKDFITDFQNELFGGPDHLLCGDYRQCDEQSCRDYKNLALENITEVLKLQDVILNLFNQFRNRVYENKTTLHLKDAKILNELVRNR